jgi:hypothetical protein
MSAPSEFDVGGVVGVRALHAGPREIAVLERELGVAPRPLGRAADIQVRFVPRLEHGASLRLIGRRDAAFGEGSFLLLGGRERAAIAVPFEQVGQRISLECEQGLCSFPLLASIVNATMLSKGFVPLRAAAFVHAGRGVLATGWSKGGKSQTLLAFVAHGARYVADERLYLAPGGHSMFGLREPIRLWSRQLACLPELRRKVPWLERLRLSLLGLIEAALPAAGPRARLQERLCVDLPAAELFPADLQPDGSEECARLRPERVLFVVDHDRPEIVVEPIDPAEVAERMSYSLLEQEHGLYSCYNKFRFAYPGRRNELLERAPSLQSELLHAALSGRPAFEVRHPSSVSLNALYRALERVCA